MDTAPGEEPVLLGLGGAAEMGSRVRPGSPEGNFPSRSGYPGSRGGCKSVPALLGTRHSPLFWSLFWSLPKFHIFLLLTACSSGQIAHQLLAEGVFGVLQSQPYMQQVDGHRLSLQMAKKCNIRAPGWLQERVGSNMPAVVIRADRRDWPEENAIIAAAKGYGRFFDAAPEDTPLSQKLSARVQKLMRSNPQALSAVQLALFR